MKHFLAYMLLSLTRTVLFGIDVCVWTTGGDAHGNGVSPPRSRALSNCLRLDSLVCETYLCDGSNDGWDWLLDSGNAFAIKHLSKMIDGITLRGTQHGENKPMEPFNS